MGGGSHPPLPHRDHNKTKITRDFRSEGKAGWAEPDQVGAGGHDYVLYWGGGGGVGGGQRLDKLAGRLQLQS